MEQDEKSAGMSRRNVVTSVGAAGIGAVTLAACGSSDSTAPAASTGAAPSSATAESTATSSGSASAAAPAGNSVPVSDIPVGGGHIDEAAKFVVTQPTAGEFKAFSAVCTHQGCLVNEVKDNVIICPCHASHFNASTGAVESGQASSPLPGMTATVEGNNVIIS